MGHVVNLPPIKCNLDTRYLHGYPQKDIKEAEFIDCYWATAKSIPGHAIHFEVLIPKYGALYD